MSYCAHHKASTAPGALNIVDYVEADYQNPEFRMMRLEELEQCKPLPEPESASHVLQLATPGTLNNSLSVAKLRTLLSSYLNILRHQLMTGPERRNAMSSVVSVALVIRQEAGEPASESLTDDLLLVLDEFIFDQNTDVETVVSDLCG